MSSKIPGIDVNKPNQNPTVDSEYSYYELPFYKDSDYMFNIEDSKGTGLKGAKPGEAGGEGTPSKKPEDMTYEDFCNQEG